MTPSQILECPFGPEQGFGESLGSAGVERVARWIVAVGPKRAELAPEQLLSAAPPGWWIGTISNER